MTVKHPVGLTLAVGSGTLFVESVSISKTIIAVETRFIVIEPLSGQEIVN